MRPLTLIGGILVALVLALALLADVITPAQEGGRINMREKLKPPSASHPFGTDELGRDVLTRVIHGARVSLASGVGIVLLTVAIGVPLGAIAGYREATGRASKKDSGLLDFFLIEKAAYEVNYEAANRPTWLAIPVGGLARIANRLLAPVPSADS